MFEMYGVKVESIFNRYWANKKPLKSHFCPSGAAKGLYNRTIKRFSRIK